MSFTNKNEFNKESDYKADKFKGVRVNNTKSEDSEPSYGYYSNILKKPFDTLESLKAAEAADAKAKSEKELAKSERKAAAEKVEAAFKAYNESKKTYNDKIRDAYKDYLKKETELHDAYNATVNEYKDNIKNAESKYTNELSKFTEKYGSFHTVLEDGDHVITIDYKNEKGILDGMLDLFSTICNKFDW